MRIGYVVTNFAPLSETFIRREVEALCHAGEHVVVYTHRRHHEPGVEEPSHENLTVRTVPYFEQPDALAGAVRSDEVEHLHGTLMVGAHHAAFAAARTLSLPFSITAYSGHSVFTAGRDAYRELSASPLCRGVVVEDEFMRDWMVERLGADAAKMFIVPNSLDLDTYRRRNGGREGGTPRILAIGRLVEKKGFIHLIEAFRALRAEREAELDIVGSGPEEPALRSAARGVGGIRFRGSLAEADCRATYLDADVYCAPCVRAHDGDADGITTTTLEAMAFEVPVVASNLLSTPCYVRDGIEGLLVEPGDSAALAASLRRLCDDDALRRRLGGNGRRRVEELCDIRRNVDALRALFAAGPPSAAPRPEAAPERPLVSICITTYNRAALVGEAVDSVLAQTYAPLDVVVVDDGSTDDTAAVLSRYGDRIRVLRHEHNRGVAAAKNFALQSSAAEARYVALLDADDRFAPDFVARCVDFLETHPELGLVYTNEVVVDECGRELWRRRDDAAWSIEGWLRTCHLRGDSWLARRKLVLETDLHDERMPMDVDYDLFYQLLERTTFGHLPEPLFVCREHRGRMTKDRLTLARCHAANLVKYGYSPEYAYHRARRNPEWVPAIEEGIVLGRRMRAQRERRKLGGAPETLAIDGGTPVRRELLRCDAPVVGQAEIDEVVAALRSGWIGPGPRAAQLEEELAAYTGAEQAVAFSSCSAALLLNLVAQGIGGGDEVIAASLASASTANAIEQSGARAVLVDVEAETLNLDAAAVARALTPRTRAIVATHFAGLPCALDEIRLLASGRRITLIEDAAHAAGARRAGRMVGSGETPAIFSAAGGGMITTGDGALAATLRTLRSRYDLTMPDLIAALALPQLRRCEALLRLRQRHARRYDAAFRPLPLTPQHRPAEGNGERHSLQLYVVRVEEERWRVSRDQIVAALQAENIGAAAPTPLPLPAGRAIVALPIAPAMSDDDADDVIDAVWKVAAAYMR